jgi:integral membrane protein
MELPLRLGNIWSRACYNGAMPSLLQRLEVLKPFTEREAWNLYRTAALAEAFGWTILIIGILWRRTDLPGHKIAVPIAGNIHGSIFLIYFAILLATYSSLGWSRLKFVIAAIAGIPPYGTLIFEQITAYYRRQHIGSPTYRVEARAIIMHGDRLLVVQPVRGTNWQLPGSEVSSIPPSNALEQALVRLTGVAPTVGRIQYIEQSGKGTHQTLTLYFAILNSAAYDITTITKQMKRSALVDEIKFLRSDQLKNLQPPYLLNQLFERSTTIHEYPIIF